MKSLKEALICALNKYNKPIIEGGAAGHLMHVIDYDELTLNDLQDLLNDLFSGKITDITEKIDGTNIQASKNDKGEVVFIRNKGDLNSVNGGMTVDDMATKWADKPKTQETFVTAGNIIKELFDKIDNKFFNPSPETRVFVNCECLTEGVTNIIPYGSSSVNFHDLWIYEFNGTEYVLKETTKKGLEKLDRAIKQYDIKNIQITPKVIVNTTEESNDLCTLYKNELVKLFKKEGLRNNNTIYEYKFKRFIQYIEDKYSWIEEKDYEIFFKRNVFKDKSTNLKTLKNLYPDNKSEIMDLDNDKNAYKYCVKDIDNLFLRIGNSIIKLCSGFVNTGYEKQCIDELRRTLDEVVKSSSNIDDENITAQITYQLNRLMELGDDSINATEGIVFNYKGKLLKLTGGFAPLNAIIGNLKYKLN